MTADGADFLLARAAGGHRLHILPPEWRKYGNDTSALCGHTPQNKSYTMRRRGKWYHVLNKTIGNCTCERCASRYEEILNRFNTYMNSHFSGCRLLARAHDDCRNRDVTIHQIPGHWDVVGVTDGTDAWVAPASAAPFFRTATGDVADIMRKLQAGEPVPPPPDAPATRVRRVLNRKPVEVTAQASTIHDSHPRTRRAIVRR